MQPAAVPPPPAPRRAVSPKVVAVMLFLLVLAFVAGYVPQKLRADRLDASLFTTKFDLELANLHRDLGVAALEAQRGNFANASTSATAFFDGCARLAEHPELADKPRTRIALSAYAGQRDQIAVQLAQADPQIAQRLASLYFTMDGVIARQQ